MELNEYQLLYIRTVYDYFRENLQWPTFRQVQSKILPTYRDFRVVEVAKSIEDNQAAHFYQHLNSPATITLKGIHHLPEAEQDLADLVKVIRYSVEKYITEDKDGVRVTSEEIGHNLHFDETAIRKNFQLLGLTTGIIGSNSNSRDYKTWSFEVSDRAIDFQDVKSIDDYFERLDERKKSNQAGRSSQKADSIISQDIDISATIEKIAQADPSDIKAIGVSALELSAGYYNEPLKQSRQSFWWARVATVVGFLFFIAAIVILLFRQPANIAIVCTIAGAVSAFIVRTFYVLYQSTSKQALAYKPQIDRAQNFIMANSTCETMDEERKQRIREKLIRWFVGLPSNNSEDKK
jgi:hypothetical protein